jgi:hypothetical protein
VGRARSSRASRGPARGRMARRYATREGSSAQIRRCRVCAESRRARARRSRPRRRVVPNVRFGASERETHHCSSGVC